MKSWLWSRNESPSSTSVHACTQIRIALKAPFLPILAKMRFVFFGGNSWTLQGLISTFHLHISLLSIFWIRMTRIHAPFNKIQQQRQICEMYRVSKKGNQNEQQRLVLFFFFKSESASGFWLRAHVHLIRNVIIGWQTHTNLHRLSKYQHWCCPGWRIRNLENT